MALALAGCGTARTAEAEGIAAIAAIETVDAAALSALVARGEVVLVDVRTPEEFAAGRIAGAVNLPLDGFDPATLPRQAGKETVLYCRSDRRSGLAARQVVAALGQPVRHLGGGILAWQAAGLPTVD